MHPIGAYLYWRDIDESTEKLSGVERKVLLQVRCLNESGAICKLMPYTRKEGLLSKVMLSLPFTRDDNHWPDLSVFDDLDFVYVRRPRYISLDLINLLSEARNRNRRLKCIVEIPTFPMDDIIRRDPLKYPVYAKERAALRRIADGFDAAAIIFAKNPTLTDMSDFNGIDILRLYNGLDMDTVPVRKQSCTTDRINILCAARFADWHGVDRVLEGLKLYYSNGGQREVAIHLAGDGSAIGRLRRISDCEELRNRVLFYGLCDSSTIDELYDTCSLGLESLGLHRVGLNLSTTLKSCEYLAKGLPYVYSGDFAFPTGETPRFCLRVSSDESPVSIEQILGYYDTLYTEHTEGEVIATLRQFAEYNCSIRGAMSNVIDYILGT